MPDQAGREPSVCSACGKPPEGRCPESENTLHVLPLAGREPTPPTPECEASSCCPFTNNGAYHGVCLWHEGSERTCTCNGRVDHEPRRGTTGRVLVLLIPDEDFAWEVFSAASEQPGVERALMVNPDHPESVASVVTPPARKPS